MWQNKNGFTLVELMIVIAIFGILGSMAIPNLARARQTADDAKIQKELNSIYTAIVMFEGLNGRKPSALSELVPNYIPISNIESKYELNPN